MKKLIFLLLFTISVMFVQGQANNNLLYQYPIATGDNTVGLRIESYNVWTMEVGWSSYNAADGTVVVMCSNDGINWVTYNSVTHYTMVATSGYILFSDFYCAMKYIGVKVTKGSNTAGIVTVNMTLKPQK
jgi:hypothetical protein